MAGDATAPDDYDRACAVDDLAGVLPIDENGAQALVLAEEPATSCYLPHDQAFLRWRAADSEAGLRAAADTALAGPATVLEECGTWVSDGPAVLMDSAEAGSDLGNLAFVLHGRRRDLGLDDRVVAAAICTHCLVISEPKTVRGLEAGYRLYTTRWSLVDLPARRPLPPAPDLDRQPPADPGEPAALRSPGRDAGWRKVQVETRLESGHQLWVLTERGHKKARQLLPKSARMSVLRKLQYDDGERLTARASTNTPLP